MNNISIGYMISRAITSSSTIQRMRVHNCCKHMSLSTVLKLLSQEISLVVTGQPYRYQTSKPHNYFSIWTKTAKLWKTASIYIPNSTIQYLTKRMTQRNLPLTQVTDEDNRFANKTVT